MLRRSAMYNLKVSTTAAAGEAAPGACPGPGAGAGLGAGLLGVDPQGVTPRTPEILNSLIAMSNPLDSYQVGAAATPDLNSPTGAVSDSCSSCSGSVTSPPSVQHTRSQLIKEGLKLTLQTKRRHCDLGDTNTDDDEDSAASGKRSKKDELTAEDEERRRRRRERNKVAATKCRIKKRERTVNLVQESEILESQNYELKSQIQELETQRRRLVDMLSTHTPTCTRPAPARSSPDPLEAAYPTYDAYTPAAAAPPYCCPSPGARETPSAAPAAYDPLASPFYPMDPYFDYPSPPQLTELESTPVAPFYPVTKHEVPDEPLLAPPGFNDDPTGSSLASSPYCALPHAPLLPGGVHTTHASHAQPGPGVTPSYQHYQHAGVHPNLPHQDGGCAGYGLDSGCMA